MNKLLALADRVEKLTGPSRQIDGEIYATLCGLDFPAGDNEKGRITRQVRMDCAKFYTGSVDASATLIPEEWSWNTWSTGYARAIHPHSSRHDKEGRAITPALALTCAALRARAHGGGEG